MKVALRGYISRYGTRDGKIPLPEIPFKASVDVAGDKVGEAYQGLKTAYNEKGGLWLAGQAIKGIITNTYETGADCFTRSVRCAIPDFINYGNDREKAFIDRLQGDAEQQRSHRGDLILTGVSVVAYVTGVGSVVAKSGKVIINGARKGVDRLKDSVFKRRSVPDSEAAAISRMSEGRFIPEDFGVSSIASDPKLHSLWTESLQNASLWSGRQNAYQKYLQIIEQGGTPTGKELSNAFSTVQGYFRRGADKAGIEIPAGDIHHWNFNKSAYPDQVFDPRNLFSTNSKIQHNSMHLNLGPGNGFDYNGPIIPTSELKIDSSFYPLPPGFFD